MGRASAARNIICLLLVLLGACISIPDGRSADDVNNTAEETEDLKRITGTVAKVSFVFSQIMLTCELGYITFSVPNDTLIMRGPREIGLEEIKTEETITIQYRQPYPSEYIATYIRASEASSE